MPIKLEYDVIGYTVTYLDFTGQLCMVGSTPSPIETATTVKVANCVDTLTQFLDKYERVGALTPVRATILAQFNYPEAWTPAPGSDHEKVGLLVTQTESGAYYVIELPSPLPAVVNADGTLKLDNPALQTWVDTWQKLFYANGERIALVNGHVKLLAGQIAVITQQTRR